MIWTVLLILALLALIPMWWWSLAATGYLHDHVGAGFFTVLVPGALLIASCIGTGINENEYSIYRHSTELVTLKQSQRDQLAVIAREELSADQYRALMAATPQADVLVILGNNAATVMVERARQLVALNNDLFGLINQLAQKRISLCAWADNPLTPRLFISPHCPKTIL